MKPIAFVALALHWFNPFVWLSFFLMAKDMEMACDENVLKRSDSDIRQHYSTALMQLASKRRGIVSPLAFGENNVKARVKNIFNFRKSSGWVIVLSVILVAVLSVGLLVRQPATASTPAGYTTGNILIDNNTQDIADNDSRDDADYSTNMVDNTSLELSTQMKHGRLVQSNPMIYEILPSGDSEQIIEDEIITNTTQIAVSTDSIKGSEEISLFLYSTASLSIPIGYATLVTDSTIAVFANLTFADIYKLGVVINGTNETVFLHISP